MDDLEFQTKLICDAVYEHRYREALVFMKNADESFKTLKLLCVQRLREDGATWSDIGCSLGVSAQAAHKAYAE